MSTTTTLNARVPKQKAYAVTEHLVTSQTYLVTAGSKEEALAKAMDATEHRDVVVIKDFVSPDPRRATLVELESTWTRRGHGHA